MTMQKGNPPPAKRVPMSQQEMIRAETLTLFARLEARLRRDCPSNRMRALALTHLERARAWTVDAFEGYQGHEEDEKWTRSKLAGGSS